MKYHYLDELTYADVAFQVEGESLKELFLNAADALTQIMVSDLNSIQPKTTRKIELKEGLEKFEEGMENLLYEFLQKLVYWKDADQLLLRVRSISINQTLDDPHIALIAEASGEPINSTKHSLGTDVKSVTYHNLKIWNEDAGWKAIVVVDA